MTEKELFSLKERIDEDKKELLQLEGAELTLLAQLQKDFKCEGLKKGEKKLIQLKKELDSLCTQVQDGLKQIQNDYYTKED